MSPKSLVLLLLSLVTLVIPICMNKWSSIVYPVGLERFLNPIFITSYIILGVRVVIWIKTLKYVDLGIAFPLMSLSFPIVLVISVFFFDETFTNSNLIGASLILLGIGLLRESK